MGKAVKGGHTGDPERAARYYANAQCRERRRGKAKRLGGLPRTLVWDHQSGLHAKEGRPTPEFARFCGELKLDWLFCEPGNPQAKGVVERLQP